MSVDPGPGGAEAGEAAEVAEAPEVGEFAEWSRVDARTVLPLVGPVIGLALFLGARSVVRAPGNIESFIDYWADDWWGLGVLALFATSRLVLYITGRFRLEGGAVQWRSGLLFRQAKQMPLSRVQDVSTSRPIVARVLNLSQVTVSSAGTDGEIQLRYLSVERAERFTAAVLSAVDKRQRTAASPSGAVGGALGGALGDATAAGGARQPAPPWGPATALPSVPPPFDPATVLDARAVDSTPVPGGFDGRGGGPRRLVHQVELDELLRSVWNSLWWLAPVSIALVVVGVATGTGGVFASPIIFIGLGVWNVIGQAIQRYNLRVELDDRSVRTTAGLTTVKLTSNRLERVQVLYATTSWIQRRRHTERVDYASADATANSEESMRENPLGLDVADGTWRRFATELFRRPVLGTAERPADYQRRPRAAMTVATLRWSIAAALLATSVLVAWVSVPMIVADIELERGARPLVVTAAVCALLVGYGAYRGWRLASVNVWAVDADDLLVRSGLLRRRTLLAPRAKVQAVRVTQGPLQRRLGLASVRVNLAPRDGSLSPWIADIGLADAQRLSAALARSACTPLLAGV